MYSGWSGAELTKIVTLAGNKLGLIDGRCPHRVQQMVGKEVMTNKDAIERLCQLVTTVGVDAFSSQNCHDCFCGGIKENEDIRIDEDVIKFIEDACEEKISKTR